MGFLGGVALLATATPRPHWLEIGMAVAAVGVCFRLWASGYLEKNVRVARSGPYRVVRHPLYFGSTIRINYRRNGATETIVASTVMRKWYDIRLEIDMDARMLDAYVDDALVTAGIPIRPGPLRALAFVGWDRPGAVFLDDFVGREF